MVNIAVALPTKAEDGGDPSAGILLHHQVGSFHLPPLMHMIDLIPFEVPSSKYILSALSQEERYQENCCPEVLLSPGPAEGSHTSLPSADFAKLNLNCGTIS